MGLYSFPLWTSLRSSEKQQMLLKSLLVAAVLGILITRYCWKKRRFWYLASKMPGPTPLPLVGNLLIFARGSLTGCFKTINRLTEMYGPVVRIWGGPKLVVLVTDAESIEKIMTNNKLNSRGPFVYRVAKPLFNKGIILSYGKIWRFHRKVINYAFHNNMIDNFVDDFARLSAPFCDNLSKVSDGTTFDLYHYSFLYSMDVVAETTMGEITNVQISHENFYTRAVLMGLDVVSERFRKPWLLNDWLYYLTELGKRMKSIMNDVNGKIFDGINKRTTKFNEGGKKKIDLEDKESVFKRKLCLLDLMIEDDNMSVEEIRDEVATIVGAGSETTATTICYVLSMLGIYGEVQDKVVEEQKEVFGQDFLRPVRTADLSQMTYLEQVIKETLRLFPPLAYIFRYISEDTEVGLGYTIPARSQCIINIYLMHRNPEYYPDPDAFKPERFSPENVLGRNPHTYIPFGGGRRLCVGYRYAILELKTVLSTVLRRYRVVRTPGGMKGLEENLMAGLVVKPVTGFPIQLLPRRL